MKILRKLHRGREREKLKKRKIMRVKKEREGKASNPKHLNWGGLDAGNRDTY